GVVGKAPSGARRCLPADRSARDRADPVLAVVADRQVVGAAGQVVGVLDRLWTTRAVVGDLQYVACPVVDGLEPAAPVSRVCPGLPVRTDDANHLRAAVDAVHVDGELRD